MTETDGPAGANEPAAKRQMVFLMESQGAGVEEEADMYDLST